MNTNGLTAEEVTVISRAKNSIPYNMRRLAKVDRSAARNLMAELYTNLIFNEKPSEEIVLDAEAFGPELIQAIGVRTEERFAAIFLDQGRRLLGKKVFEGGSRTRTTLYPRILFKAALEFDATGIILAHNHPGGTCLPSPQDRDLTRRVAEIGESLEIRLLDHLIVTATEAVSFRRKGWL